MHDLTAMSNCLHSQACPLMRGEIKGERGEAGYGAPPPR
jgi:hypothetical protein